MAKYEPLKTVVAYFLDQYDKSEDDQDKFWLIAIRGLEKMHYNVSAEPKTLLLPVEANQIAYFPPDCVTWVKIGLRNERGEINTLKVNRALTKYRSDMPNRLEGLTPDIVDGLTSNNSPFINYMNNGNYETLFGVGQAGIITHGECNIDEDKGIVLLSPSFQHKNILFEYISSPEKDDDYKVDVRLRESIIAFMEWKADLKPRALFYAEATEARRIIKPVRTQTFNQTIRENERFTLKV
jgi:hypothetical protein